MRKAEYPEIEPRKPKFPNKPPVSPEKPLKRKKVKIKLTEWVQFYWNKYKPFVKAAVDSVVKYVPMPIWLKVIIDFINKNTLKLTNGGFKMNFLKGKKTYIVLGLFIVLFVLVHFNVVNVPESVWVLLTALGVGFIRSALQAVNQNKGWKTYLAVIVTILIAGAQTFGLDLPAETVTLIYTVTGGLGVVGIRDAVNKLNS